MYSLCCISEELKPAHSFKSMTWTSFKTDMHLKLEELGSRWLNNVIVTHLNIIHCKNNGWNYRVSSSLFPLLTHPEFKYSLEDVPQYDAIMEEFSAIREEEYPVRLSTHPDQFVVLATDNDDTAEKSIKELNYHGMIMDLLGCDRSYRNPINIHVNCSKGNHQEIADKFMNRLSQTDMSVQSRLVVENEDKGIWNVESLLKYFDLPITYDNLHDRCNPSPNIKEGITYLCAKTWGEHKPLYHYCESNGSNKRAHADMPISFPFNDDYDWEIELKSKDYAIREIERLKNGYPYASSKQSVFE